MHNQIVQALLDKNLKLSTAESFTAGRVASTIISVSGASKVFYEGLVCYNTQAKIDRLGVKTQTLSEFGVVSEQVAREMIQGLIATNDCDIAFSSTGYADKTEDGGEVGLTYLAVGDKNKTIVEENTFCGDREQVTAKATQRGLEILLKFINERK